MYYQERSIKLNIPFRLPLFCPITVLKALIDPCKLRAWAKRRHSTRWPVYAESLKVNELPFQRNWRLRYAKGCSPKNFNIWHRVLSIFCAIVTWLATRRLLRFDTKDNPASVVEVILRTVRFSAFISRWLLTRARYSSRRIVDDATVLSHADTSEKQPIASRQFGHAESITQP